MIGVMKLITLGSMGVLAYGGMKNAPEQVKRVLELPKCVLTLSELKTIHRLISYDLAGGQAVPVELRTFCKSNLKARGRNPANDFWNNPYRLYYKGQVYPEDSMVTIESEDEENFSVFSAGPDRKFHTKDDLVSTKSMDSLLDTMMGKFEAAGNEAAGTREGREVKPDEDIGREIDSQIQEFQFK